MFDYYETENQWKYNADFSASGKGGLAKLISAEAAAIVLSRLETSL